MRGTFLGTLRISRHHVSRYDRETLWGIWGGSLAPTAEMKRVFVDNHSMIHVRERALLKSGWQITFFLSVFEERYVHVVVPLVMEAQPVE